MNTCSVYYELLPAFPSNTGLFALRQVMTGIFWGYVSVSFLAVGLYALGSFYASYIQLHGFAFRI